MRAHRRDHHHHHHLYHLYHHQVWVLTGDKLETAISIGLSCSIIEEDMTLLVLSHKSLGLDDTFDTLAQLRQSGKFRETEDALDFQLTQVVMKIHEVGGGASVDAGA
jgi:magnesium-transporting ATPase (P-type)